MHTHTSSETDMKALPQLETSNILYRLHRSYLVLDSGFFEMMLSFKPENVGEGLSDQNPVVLPNILRCDFDQFLDFLLWQ